MNRFLKTAVASACAAIAVTSAQFATTSVFASTPVRSVGAVVDQPRWQVIVAPINTQVQQPSLFELPVAGIIKLFEVSVPFVGWAAADAYSREADNRFVQPMKAPGNAEEYTIVRVHTIEESVSGAGSRGWSGLGTSTAHFRWELRRKGFFEGASWFGGSAIAVAVRKGVQFSQAEADAVMHAAISNVQDQPAKAADVRRKAEEERKRVPRERPSHRGEII